MATNLGEILTGLQAKLKRQEAAVKLTEGHIEALQKVLAAEGPASPKK